MNQPIQRHRHLLAAPASNSRAASRRAILVGGVLLALVGFAVSPGAQAVSPPPPGAYPNSNTAAGSNALQDVDTNPDGGRYNVAVGTLALADNTIGDENTAVGAFALLSNKTGSQNVAVGTHALHYNVASGNTATGYFALFQNYSGSYNTAYGFRALEYNSRGTQNTANGSFALNRNHGSYNTATGFRALTSNSLGNSNTAMGTNSLLNNGDGNLNTATGDRALVSNSNGSANVANGGGALASNISGSYNTAAGANSLYANTDGIYNVALGGNALNANNTGRDNTGIGTSALYANTTGNSNIALGFTAGRNLTTGNNNIVIGHVGVAGQANTIQIGTQGTQTATYIAGIRGTVLTGSPVVVDASGRAGTEGPSSKRFKQQIEPMKDASETILALKPVTFRYKEELDPEKIPQFGLVAEEVEKVNPDLVAYDADGKPYTVRYEAVNAMLLNEFLKQYREVQEQKAIIAKQQKQFGTALAEQRKEIQALATNIKKQASLIQQMSARLESREPGARIVTNQ